MNNGNFKNYQKHKSYAKIHFLNLTGSSIAMSLKTTINEQIKTLMKDRQLEKVKVLRNVQAVIKQIEIDRQIELDDTGVLDILQKQIKQRQESLTIFEQNGRDDLANKERFEIDIISQFLPQPLSSDELYAIVKDAIIKLDAKAMSDMGKVMNAVKSATVGRADPALISQIVKASLQAQ